MTNSNAVSPPPSTPLLQLQGVETSYGDSKVLFGVNLEINAGQCAALLGRNGMGKSTTVKAIMGLQPVKKAASRYAAWT
jgi:branched-chain amino acid transport system ATP-binding protein